MHSKPDNAQLLHNKEMALHLVFSTEGKTDSSLIHLSKGGTLNMLRYSPTKLTVETLSFYS